MNLPIQLHYRCSFDISEPYIKGDLWTDCTKTIRQWISYKAKPEKGSPYWSGWFFRGGDWKHPRYNSVSIKTDCHIGDGSDVAPQFWSLSYRHPCGECSQRMWQTDIGSDHRLRFNMQVGHYMRANFLGDLPEVPNPSAPGIIMHLLKDNLWNCEAGTQELLNAPEVIREGQTENLVRMLKDDGRTCPIVLVSKDPQTRRTIVDSRELQTWIAGAGSVYILDNWNVQEEFEFLMAHRYRCNDGMVRVYLPELDFENERDTDRHRFFFPAHIRDCGPENINKQLVRMICRFAPRRKGQSIFALDELLNIKRASRLVELREKQTDGSQEEWIQLLEDVNKEQDTGIQELERQREDLELRGLEKDDDLSRKDYELRSTRAQIETLHKESREQQQKLTALSQFGELPETLPEVLRMIGELYPDTVVATEQAMKSTEEYSEFKEIAIAWKCLWAMATELHRIHFTEKDSKNIEKEFHAASGFELSLNEGKQTKRDSGLMRLRQVTYKEEALDITPHVKYGNREPKCLRVYYHPHHGEKKIIIGHCGPHLENRTTSKIK